MNHDINYIPILKDIESNLFHELQDVFREKLVRILESLDDWLCDNRDFKRFENREKQEATLATMFGSITVNRRKYRDRYKGERIALLDRYLQFDGESSLSPFLAEMAVHWAVRGPSYRDARDRFRDLLGYEAISHERIRQEVLQLEGKDIETETHAPKKERDVLFLEVDGLNVHKQQSDRTRREVKIGVVHEGWEKRHPSSRDYGLENKSYWQTLEDGETFWDRFSRYVYGTYDITDTTQVVINGDGAPWIRAGVDYFPNAIYTYDRYHLKPWIKDALGYRTKQERRRCYLAADANDPAALLTAIAEAEKAEEDDDKKAQIKDLRLFVLNNQDAFRDYRDVLRHNYAKLDISWMRPMGAGESNMNLFSRRLKKMGCSWSYNGLTSMLDALVHRFEGTLTDALNNVLGTSRIPEEKPEPCPSFASLLTEKSRQSIGAIQGTMPALSNRDQTKPYGRALRGLAGY